MSYTQTYPFKVGVQYADSHFLFYHDVISLMKEYAKLMCEEQRKICTRKARTKKENGNYYDEKVVDEDSILNSPLPPELR